MLNASDASGNFMPVFSPDSTKIAFCTPGFDWASGSIETIPVTGGTPTTVVSSTSRLLWQPIYSPDGSEIVYSSITEGGSAPTYSITMTDTATGSHSIELTHAGSQSLQIFPIGWTQ